MVAAVLLRSVARKMSRAAASTHHRSLVARGLHGGARSGPANNSNQIQQAGAADVLVSAGMAAATGLRSGAGWLRTRMAHAPPPPPYHCLVHGRGIHSRTSPDPTPSKPQKFLDTITIEKARAGMAYITLVSAAIYMHFWVKPKVDEVTALAKVLYEETLQLIDSQWEENMDASSVSHQTPTTPALGHGNKIHKGTGVIDKLSKEEAVKMIKELETNIMDLKAEIAELKIAVDSSRSQGKV